MISRRNYFTITAIMLVVFFMFQFTNVVLEGWKGYEENAYAQDREGLTGQGSAYEQKTAEGAKDSREKVVYIGEPDGDSGNIVYNWVEYTKRVLESYSTLEEYKGDDHLPKMLVIDAKHLDWEEESICKQLKEYVEKGVTIIFGSLPDVSVIKSNQTLMNLLGITNVRQEKTTAEGIQLYEGFLLGGKIVYQVGDEKENEKKQDMELTFPWYSLTSDTKMYMCGIPKEEMDAKDYPPVIWKKNFDKAQVFAVNGGYMDDIAGLGLLSAKYILRRIKEIIALRVTFICRDMVLDAHGFMGRILKIILTPSIKSRIMRKNMKEE